MKEVSKIVKANLYDSRKETRCKAIWTEGYDIVITATDGEEDFFQYRKYADGLKICVRIKTPETLKNPVEITWDELDIYTQKAYLNEEPPYQCIDFK